MHPKSCPGTEVASRIGLDFRPVANSSINEIDSSCYKGEAGQVGAARAVKIRSSGGGMLDEERKNETDLLHIHFRNCGLIIVFKETIMSRRILHEYSYEVLFAFRLTVPRTLFSRSLKVYCMCVCE
jgi:hypothetical protein